MSTMMSLEQGKQSSRNLIEFDEAPIEHFFGYSTPGAIELYTSPITHFGGYTTPVPIVRSAISIPETVIDIPTFPDQHHADIQSMHNTITQLGQKIDVLERDLRKFVFKESLQSQMLSTSPTDQFSLSAVTPPQQSWEPNYTNLPSSTPAMIESSTPVEEETEFTVITHGPPRTYQSHITPVVLNNRFEQLYACSSAEVHEPDEVESEISHNVLLTTPVRTPDQPTLARQQHLRRRPQICYGDSYVNNMQQYQHHHTQELNTEQQPTHQQPTPQQHESQENAKPLTLVVSDSICAGIRNAPINDMLNTHSVAPFAEEVHVEKHLGATAKQLRFYSKYNLEHMQPQNIVVVAGANDISNEYTKPNPDHRQIADQVIQIGRDAKQLGVREVYIIAIIHRRDKKYAQLTSLANIELRLLSDSEGFHYVDTGLIKADDLQADGLHVNYHGKKKMMHTILSCCASYNPAYGYMFNYLNKWGVPLNC